MINQFFSMSESKYFQINESIELEICFANKSDNQAIIHLMNNIPLSSDLSYTESREPDFFGLTKKQGQSFEIIIAKDLTGKVYGALTVIFNKAYIDNKIVDIAYTAELRVDKLAIGTGLADKLMQEGIEICWQKYNQDIPIFTCVFKDNIAGLKKNQNLKKIGLTDMKIVGEISAYYILPFQKKLKIHNNGYIVRRSCQRDLLEMYDLWNKVNKSKNLSKGFFDYQDFESWVSETDEYGNQSFLIVKKNNKIVSFMGLWDQMNLRKIVIKNESKVFKLTRFLWNNFANVISLPKLAKKDQPIKFINALNLCISPKNMDCLPLLLKEALVYVRKNDYLFLSLALDSKNELNDYLKSFFYSKSELYLLSNFESKENNLFHLELSLG